MIPGEVLFDDGPIVYNAGRAVTRLTVLNAADRPVQVGSTTTSRRPTRAWSSTVPPPAASG